MVFLAVGLLFVATALGATVLLAVLLPTPDPQLARLQQLAAPRSAAAAEAAGRRRVAGRVQRLAERLGRKVPSRNPKAQLTWRQLLIQAGYRNANAVFGFQGYRILLTVLLPATYLFLAPHLKGWDGPRHVAAVLALVAAGLFSPHWWLLRQVKRRQEEISGALPNALDLMVVCVEAGLGLDATIQRLAQERQFTKQALSEEFQLVSQEVRAGRPRAEALLALKERVGLAEVASLVVVLLQAERMGTGIARALRVHADSLRTKQRQRAEEQAAKIPVKMVFPLVLLIFPATLLVLLGPSYIIIFKAMAAMKK